MVRYLTESDVQKLLTMPLALQWMEEAHRAPGDDLADLGEEVPAQPALLDGRQITLYESHGMGLQDVFVGAKILELARARSIGQDMPIGG